MAKNNNKTNKALKKRVKVTATGKLMRQSPGLSHLLGKMSRKSKRQNGKASAMPDTVVKKYKSMINA